MVYKPWSKYWSIESLKIWAFKTKSWSNYIQYHPITWMIWDDFRKPPRVLNKCRKRELQRMGKKTRKVIRDHHPLGCGTSIWGATSPGFDQNFFHVQGMLGHSGVWLHPEVTEVQKPNQGTIIFRLGWALNLDPYQYSCPTATVRNSSCTPPA